MPGTEIVTQATTSLGSRSTIGSGSLPQPATIPSSAGMRSIARLCNLHLTLLKESSTNLIQFINQLFRLLKSKHALSSLLALLFCQ